MKDIEVIDDFIATEGISEAEFAAKANLSRAIVATWRMRGLKMRDSTERRIRKVWGIEFLRNRTGEIIGWEKSNGKTRGKNHTDTSASVEREQRDQDTRHLSDISYSDELTPMSAQELYEETAFYGGGPDWLELPDDTRNIYEGFYRKLELELEAADIEYETALKKAKADFLAKRREAARSCREQVNNFIMRGQIEKARSPF